MKLNNKTTVFRSVSYWNQEHNGEEFTDTAHFEQEE